MNHRTYGETKDCKGCRYWSEMIAKCDNGVVMAYCLNRKSNMSGKYTSNRQTCETWASGELGTIDEPGSDSNRYDNYTLMGGYIDRSDNL